MVTPVAVPRNIPSLPLASALFSCPAHRLIWLPVPPKHPQVQGKDRAEVEEAGRVLGLEGTYIPHSYIELVQIGHLTEVGRCRQSRHASRCK